MKVILTVILALLSIETAFANDFETTYIRQLAAYYPTLKSNTKDIWPGFQISNKHPALIYFTSSADHIYGFDFTPKNPDWQKQTISGLPVYYLPNDEIGIVAFNTQLMMTDLNATKENFQPYFTVDGQPTIAFEAFEQSSYAAENFAANTLGLINVYYFYYELSDSPYAQSKFELLKKHIAYSGFRQTDNLTLLYLENELIEAYLTTSDPEFLKDYVALNVTRNKLLDAQTAEYEQTWAPFVFYYISMKGITTNEAEYTQLALALKKESPAFYDPNAEFLQDGFYEALLAFSASGVDLGLDRLNPSWKDTVESKNTAPDLILQQYFNLSDSEIQTRLAAVKTRLGYDGLNQKIKAVVCPYSTKIDELQKSYQADSGVELIVSLPHSDYINIAGYQEDGASYNVTSDTTVSSGGNLNLVTGRLEFSLDIHNMPVLYHSKTDVTQSLAMKLNPASTLKIDDGTKTTIEKFIAEGKSITAYQVIISNDKTIIYITDVNEEFSLESKDGKLQLTITNANANAAANTVSFLALKKRNPHELSAIRGALF
ncbi:MAG: hypothetical protein V4501_06190 [Pseudomonadota bacterium]